MMDKRVVAIIALIIVIWLDALVDNYVLLSNRETLALKISEVKQALTFQRYIELVEECHPFMPRRGLSHAAVTTYKRMREEILLKTKEEAEREWKEDVERAQREYDEYIESLQGAVFE